MKSKKNDNEHWSYNHVQPAPMGEQPPEDNEYTLFDYMDGSAANKENGKIKADPGVGYANSAREKKDSTIIDYNTARNEKQQKVMTV